MNYLMAYDISDNKNRKRVSDLLIEKGFLRVQNSVFMGEISSNKIDEIIERICMLIDESQEAFLCVPIDKENYENIFNYGKSKDYNVYEDEVLYL